MYPHSEQLRSLLSPHVMIDLFFGWLEVENSTVLINPYQTGLWVSMKSASGDSLCSTRVYQVFSKQGPNIVQMLHFMRTSFYGDNYVVTN